MVVEDSDVTGAWQDGKVQSSCRGALNLDVDCVLLLPWGPQSLHPHPFLPGCLNEQDAYDPSRVGGKRFLSGLPTNSAQLRQFHPQASLPSPVAPVGHGQDKSPQSNISIFPTGKPQQALQPLDSEVKVEG